MTRPKVARRPPPGLLTPQQFAFRVDSSARELDRLHSAGLFVAKIGGGAGRGHQRMYGEEQVSTFLRLYSPRGGSATDEAILHLQERVVPFTGEQAQKGFIALSQGKNLADLVLQHGFHPDVAKAVALSWADLTESVILDKAVLDESYKLPLSGPVPIRNAKDFLEILTLAAEETSCSACGKSVRAICKKCATQAIAYARQEEREKALPKEADPAVATG